VIVECGPKLRRFWLRGLAVMSLTSFSRRRGLVKGFAFCRAGRDYVLRLGAYVEDFAKDRLLARLCLSRSADPRVVELGRSPGGYYAIAERVFGTLHRRRRRAQMRALLPRCSRPLMPPARDL